METPETKDEMPHKTLREIVMDKAGGLSPQHTAEEAATKMRALDTEALPVSEDRRLVGMIRNKFADRHIASHGHDPKAVRVGEQMTNELIYCFEDQDRAEADRIVKEKDFRYLPVVDGEMRIVGIITRADVE